VLSVIKYNFAEYILKGSQQPQFYKYRSETYHGQFLLPLIYLLLPWINLLLI